LVEVEGWGKFEERFERFGFERWKRIQNRCERWERSRNWYWKWCERWGSWIWIERMWRCRPFGENERLAQVGFVTVTSMGLFIVSCSRKFKDFLHGKKW
jgi:hypothetical protein